MQLSDEQIVKILMGRYSQEGVDTSKLFSDPVFNALPLRAKLNAIKTYAGKIREGTPSGIDRREGTSVLDTAIGTVAGVAPVFMMAGKLGRMAKPVSPMGMAFLGVSGAALGGGVAYLRARAELKAKAEARDKIRAHLASLAQYPTDSNSVSTLSHIGTTQPNMRTHGNIILNAILNNIDKNMSEFNESMYFDGARLEEEMKESARLKRKLDEATEAYEAAKRPANPGSK